MIDGDEDDKLNQYKVIFKDFLNYICKKPEWLYRKLWLIYKQFKDVVEDCNI